MLRRTTKGLLLLVSLWLAAGPLALLQLGAWAWMITSYSQESSIEQAFRETFGGDRPCDMCRLIDTVETEQDGAAPLPNKKDFQSLKLMLGLGRAIRLPQPRTWEIERLADSWAYESVGQRVPTPPPRSLA
ncbi:MAG: hypothetical protein ACPG3X_02215 [Opitutales bacterium]